MAGLIATLFGGKNKKPDPYPLPGIGGYDMPRGPMGEGGFPGSTSAAPPTHPQSSQGSRQRYRTASEIQDDWTTITPVTRSGLPDNPRALNKRQLRDTEKLARPAISSGIPGNNNQRNTKYYGGRRAIPDGMNRYVFNGINGGYETWAFDRQIPYRVHYRNPGYEGVASVRGATLDGTRLNMESSQNLNQGGMGDYGLVRQRSQRHRPVSFTQPGPWTANYRDEAPYQGEEAPQAVFVSPSSKTSKAPKKPAHSAPSALSVRQEPASRKRVQSQVSRRSGA